MEITIWNLDTSFFDNPAPGDYTDHPLAEAARELMRTADLEASYAADRAWRRAMARDASPRACGDAAGEAAVRWRLTDDAAMRRIAAKVIGDGC
jgi:hypothetical protein